MTCTVPVCAETAGVISRTVPVVLIVGFVEQADDHRFVLRRLCQQRFVDVEHRVALAVPGQAENRHGGLHHLADFGLTRGNHPRRVGDQRGVAQLFTGVGQLRLGRRQGALAAAQGGLGGIVFALAGVALGQEFLLANESGGGLFDSGLFGNDLRLSRVDAGLQVLGIEFGQHLFGRNPITDIDRTLDDLAANAERQVGLDPRLNITGQGHRRRVIRRFYLLHEYPRTVLFDRFFIATGAQQDKEAQANHCFQSGTQPCRLLCVVRTCQWRYDCELRTGFHGCTGLLHSLWRAGLPRSTAQQS